MKFGIVGTNFVSEFFMNGAKEVAECEVVAVSDISLEMAKKFADKYNIPNAFDSFEEMAESNLIDAVYIAVPNGLHHKISCYFLNKKIPTFCEKPLAGNYAEVKSMIDCATENDTYLQEGLIPLYNPNFKILKDSLPLVGRIHQVTLNFSKYSSRYDAYLRGENPTTFRPELANGAIMDLGVYVIADCIGLWGQPNKVLSECSLLDTGADISGTSIFVYDDFNVSISYSKASDTGIECEICGENGILKLDQPSQPTVITFIDRKTGEKQILSVEKKENFYYEISEMIEQIKDNKKESRSVPFKTSLEVHSVLTECRKQANLIFPCDQ